MLLVYVAAVPPRDSFVFPGSAMSYSMRSTMYVWSTLCGGDVTRTLSPTLNGRRELSITERSAAEISSCEYRPLISLSLASALLYRFCCSVTSDHSSVLYIYPNLATASGRYT